jgi:hypothetical protein
MFKPCCTLAACLALAACGGGSGTATAPQPVIVIPPETPNTVEVPDPGVVSSFQTNEYNMNWGMDAVNAAEAYALGYTGEDVLVGVIDFNFDFQAGEVNYHSASVGPDPDAIAIYEAQIGEERTDSTHGHAVSATIAGLKDDVGIHGIAFDAEILGVDFFSNVNTDHFFSGGIRYTISDPWEYAFNQGARIFNKSLGYDEDDIIENPPAVSERYVLEFDTRVVELGGLLVSSAGNNSDPEPSLSNLDALQRLSDDGLLNSGEGAIILVGSVNEGLTLSSFSDAAGSGESRFHYMVAPGEGLTFPWEGDLVVGSGTSFAAPYVTAAAAIVLSRWPSLTGRELADILFESATDLGDAGVDAVYGHGLLNIEAALQPSGASKIAASSGPTQAASKAAIKLGPAFGDAQQLQEALRSLMVLDKYDRDFFIDGSKLVETSPAGMNLESRFTSRREWQSAGLQVTQGNALNYAVRSNKDSIPTFALAGQAEGDFTHDVDAVFELAGSAGGSNWIVGTGRTLSSAVARDSFNASIGKGFSLTGVNDSSLPLGDGAYIAVNRQIDDQNSYWLGVSYSAGATTPFHPLESMRKTTQTAAIVARFDHQRADSSFGFEIGGLIEDGAFLGSKSVGGISIGSKAMSTWLSSSAHFYTGQNWSFSARATLAHANPESSTGSVIDHIGNVLSSAFNLTAQKQSLLLRNDALTFSVKQPLRVESGHATIRTGSRLDAKTGEVIYTDTVAALSPSGRELAMEAAYRANLSGWQFEANAAFRQNAGHWAGHHDTLFALYLYRAF